MRTSIRFEDKGVATLTELKGEYATLQTDFSAPPGATLQGVISNSTQQVQIKVRDCRRLQGAPIQFVLRGRLVNLSRPAKAILTDSLAANLAK